IGLQRLCTRRRRGDEERQRRQGRTESSEAICISQQTGPPLRTELRDWTAVGARWLPGSRNLRQAWCDEVINRAAFACVIRMTHPVVARARCGRAGGGAATLRRGSGLS